MLTIIKKNIIIYQNLLCKVIINWFWTPRFLEFLVHSGAKKIIKLFSIQLLGHLLILPVVLFKPELFKLWERCYISLYSAGIISQKNIFKSERTDILEEKMPFYF